MKKLFLIAMVCVCVCLASCNKFEPVVTPLNDNLESYTELSGDKKDTLTGVRTISEKTIIIEPSSLAEVYADGYIIETIDKEKVIKYYTHSGKLIGEDIRMFGPVETEDKEAIFYKGNENDKNVFYFPETGLCIKATAYYIGYDLVAVNTLETTFGQAPAEALNFFNYKGNLLSSLPANSKSYLVKKNGEFFVVIPAFKNKVVLQGIDGKKIKTISSGQWKTALKRAQRGPIIGAIELVEIPKNIKL